jgi:hypothetical protein
MEGDKDQFASRTAVGDRVGFEAPNYGISARDRRNGP